MAKMYKNIAAPAVIKIFLFLSSILSCSVVLADDDVPTHIAIPPKMNPKLKLPDITNYVYLDVEYGWKNEQDRYTNLKLKRKWNVYQRLHREKEADRSDSPRATKRKQQKHDQETRTSDRIILGLFGNIAPKAVENFLGLCSCDKGDGMYTKKPLCLKGTTFHRIVRHLMIQGGDFSHGDGTGGESIYGGYFEDESFEVEFKKPYLLAMANMGSPDTNGSQFFITVAKPRWLDGKNVVFGAVVANFDSVDYIENFGSFSGETQREVRIVGCGELSVEEINIEIES